MKEKLSLIHLQLTRLCNLRCSFCGQWRTGANMSSSNSEMTTSDWLRLIYQIKESGGNPQFILWGGEPLISAAFVPVARKLKEYGFTTALVTNGVKLGKFAEVINETINTVYVSLDGPRKIHERIRMKKGIFPQIISGIKKLNKTQIELVCLFTLCEENFRFAPDFPILLEELGFNKVIFQPLIFCSPEQGKQYRNWLAGFNQPAGGIAAWETDHFGDWTNNLPAMLKELRRRKYKIGVELYPYELNADNIIKWFSPEYHFKTVDAPCLMPYRHLHINADGETHFCVDFNDFSLGNVQKSNPVELFMNETAEKFRSEFRTCNPLCGRCPWYYNQTLNID